MKFKQRHVFRLTIFIFVLGFYSTVAVPELSYHEWVMNAETNCPMKPYNIVPCEKLT